MAEEIVINEEEQKSGGGGNKNALAYGLLAGANINTEGMTPSEAWAMVDQLKLMERKDRKKNQDEKKDYADKNKNAKKNNVTKESIIQKAGKISKRVAIHTNNISGMNTAIDTVTSLMKEYGLDNLNYIGTKKHIGKSLYSAEAEANGRTLNISTQFLNNPNYFYRSAVEDFESETKKEIKGYEDMLKKETNNFMKKQIENSIAWLKGRVPFDRSNVCYKGQEVQSVIYHEFGHILADQYFGQANGNLFLQKGISKNKAKQKKDLVEKIYNESITNGDIFKISKYSSKNSHEFFAECFCIYKMRKEKLPTNIENMMKGVLKK